MIRFENVNVKDYAKIKRGLKKSFKTIPCLSDNRSVIETFDILSTNSKLSSTYFKSKKLEKGKYRVIKSTKNKLFVDVSKIFTKKRKPYRPRTGKKWNPNHMDQFENSHIWENPKG